MSSLNTLLEAARFLELQEQSRETVAETLVTMKPARVRTPPVLELKAAAPPPAPAPLPPQTIVISSSNSVGHQAVIHQGQITFATHSPPQYLKKMEQDGQVSSTTALPLPRRVLHNSFDIRNPPAADDPGRKQPPMVFRAGTREVHNKLEKHRRAHLKECFDGLKKQLPAAQDEKKTSNLSILHSALRYIQTLKRKERELEHEMERLARDKIASQQRLAALKKDIAARHDDVDFSKLLPEAVPPAAAAAPLEAAPPAALATDYPQMDKVAIPILAKNSQVQTTLVPVPYPVPHHQGGLVLQKVLVPKGLDGLAPLVSTHFLAAPGKVVPLAQYLMKPVVVVSTASARPS